MNLKKYLLNPYLALLQKITPKSIKNNILKSKKGCVTFCQPPLTPECHVLFERPHIYKFWNRALHHSMVNFFREFPQLRCTKLQLKMRLASRHLQLKRVAHEQNTRLAVSSRAQRGSVADK